MELKKIKTIDLENTKKYNFILPLGATEQHGPFIPIGTDTYIIDYLVKKVSSKYPEIIVLPTLEYSRSQEHRGFPGTVWLKEETLEKVMFDICNSIKKEARNIFITSFHANDLVIKKFIKENNFKNINIVHLEVCDEEDEKLIFKILNGSLDDHAGNTEISNMLAIDKSLVEVPSPDFKKREVNNPWETDNLIEKSPNGIVDNHPKWITEEKTGKEILNIYENRLRQNLKSFLNKD